MAIIIEAPRAVHKDFRLSDGSHPMHLALAPHVWNVRPGTPLRPTAQGWDIAKDWTTARAIAVTQGHGGDKVHARRSASFDVGSKRFLPGDTFSIEDIDDTGFVTFKRDPEGPFFAESESLIHMSV